MKSEIYKNLLSRNFILLLLVNLLAGIAYSIVLPQFTSVAIAVGFPKDKVAMINTVANLITIFFLPVFSFLLDRYNRKNMSAIGLLIMTAGYLMSAFSLNPWVVAAGKVVNNIGFQLALVSRMTLVSTIVEQKYRGAGLSIWAMTTAGGQIVGSAIGTPLLAMLGAKGMLCTSAITCLVSAVLSELMQIKAVPAPRKSVDGRHKISLEPAAIPAGIMNILYTLPYTAITTYIVLFANEQLNFASGALYITLYNVVNFLFRGVSAGLLTKAGIRLPLILGGASCIMSMGVLYFVPNLLGFFLSAVFWGAGFSLNQSALTTYAVLGIPKERLGAANSTYQISGQLNGLFGGILITALFSVMGLKGIFLAMAGPMILGLLLFVVFFSSTVKQKEQESLQQKQQDTASH